MNVIVYILLAAFAVFVFYKVLMPSGGRNGVNKVMDLTTEQPSITTLLQPAAANYTYSMWLYLNLWQASTGETAKTVFDTTNGTDTMQKLTLDDATPTLRFHVRRNKITSASETTDKVESIVITDTFPLQKWVHVVIVASTRTFDFYIDGKLRHSVTISAQPVLNATTVKFGGGGLDCRVASFYRAVDHNIRAPAEVYREYLSSNGLRTASTASSVHGTVQITRDDQVASQIKLF